MPPRYIAVPFTTGGGQLPIPTPSITATTVSGTQINLSIIYAGPPGASSFAFERATNGAGPFVPIASGTSSSFPDTGLTFQTTYFYRGRVQVNDGRFSSYSAIVSATTLASVPGQPQNLNAVSTGTTTTHETWNAVSQATSYNIYRDGVLVGSSATNSFDDSGLTQATTYSYTVTAVNSTGEGPASLSDSVTTDTGAPTGTVKWFPGVYGASFAILQGGRLYTDSHFTGEYSRIVAAPAQVIGYRTILTWANVEPVEANPGNFNPNGNPANDGNYHWAEIDGTLASIGGRKWAVQINFGKFNTSTQSLPGSGTDEAVPGYLKASSATYGAAVPASLNTSNISGCYAQQTGGWCANIINPNVLIKAQQFLNAFARRYNTNPQLAFAGICEDSNMIPMSSIGPSFSSSFRAAYMTLYQTLDAAMTQTPCYAQTTFQFVPQDSETVIEDMQARGVLWGTADTIGISQGAGPPQTVKSWGGNMLLGTYNLLNPGSPVSGVIDRRPFMRAAVDRQGSAFDRAQSTSFADYIAGRNALDKASAVFFCIEPTPNGQTTAWYNWESFIVEMVKSSNQLTNTSKPSFLP